MITTLFSFLLVFFPFFLFRFFLLLLLLNLFLLLLSHFLSLYHQPISPIPPRHHNPPIPFIRINPLVIIPIIRLLQPELHQLPDQPEHPL
ncbi:hypothetical protein B0J18DRAFT_439825 [Chaetomium sp. MPI-SDFR-AT-0129]|nr:hypothetical protein B0J18DRAFT_439825 [Chaetomium sp. MPI-SDFR-AT-0129]